MCHRTSSKTVFNWNWVFIDGTQGSFLYLLIFPPKWNSFFAILTHWTRTLTLSFSQIWTKYVEQIFKNYDITFLFTGETPNLEFLSRSNQYLSFGILKGYILPKFWWPLNFEMSQKRKCSWYITKIYQICSNLDHWFILPINTQTTVTHHCRNIFERFRLPQNGPVLRKTWHRFVEPSHKFLYKHTMYIWEI